MENLIGGTDGEPQQRGLALTVPDEVLTLFQEATSAVDPSRPIEDVTPEKVREFIKISRKDPENESDFNGLILLAYCLADPTEQDDFYQLPLLPLIKRGILQLHRFEVEY